MVSADTPRRRIEEPFYPLTWSQAQQDYADGLLTPRGLIYCYFRTHLRPGAEMQIDVDALCRLLTVHEATYYREIGALKAHGRLNVRRGQMIVGIPELPALYAQSQLRESNSQLCESDSQLCESDSQLCENGNQLNALQDMGSRSSANVPNRSLNLKDRTNKLVPTRHPVVENVDREGIGTETQDPSEEVIQSLSDLLQQAGVKPNQNIQRTIATVLSQQGAAATTRIVENAISALQEQQKQGTVRNPGGFIVAALRRSFTANQAKKQARQQRQPSPPDLVQTALAIDQALWAGDRPFALAKLQALWQEGWQQQIDELCCLRKRDWGFVVTATGVSDTDEQ